MQEELIKLLLAISDGRSDEASDFVLRISDTREEFDESDFRRRTAQLIADQKDAPLGERDVGKALLEVGKIAAETGLYVPIELTMLGKTLLQLDQVGKTLSPNFNPNASVPAQCQRNTLPTHVEAGVPEQNASARCLN
jgi:predicted unusual protein kinase regulating ubiquinone biosynthesis (AarF/ABC1/UbiB family)